MSHQQTSDKLTERPYSYLVDSLLPEYIKAEFPIYVKFIKRYFKALEEESGPVEVLYSITKHIDISRADDEDLVHFIYQYLHSFPGEVLDEVNIRLFIQQSKTFYSTKGTNDSYQFVFNLLGGSLEIYYPSNDIFHLNLSSLSGKARYISNIDGDATTITVDTKIYHGVDVDERIVISGTDNYDGSYFVDSIIDDDTFTIASVEHDFAAETVGVIALNQLHSIHDNTYYAYYVYEITTDLDEDKYKDIVDGLVHPVGTKRFHKREEFDNFLKFQYSEASQFIAFL